MQRFFILIFIGALLISCAEKRQMPITDLSTADLENAVLLDVRTPGEFAEGHLEGAVNMDWYQEDFIDNLERIDQGDKVYVYCKKGGRSAAAAKLMDSLGYKVVDLTGGYDAWLDSKN